MKEAIFEMYKQLSIGKSKVCLECKQSIDLENPLSFYYIGEEFHSSDDNVLFIGKTIACDILRTYHPQRQL